MMKFSTPLRTVCLALALPLGYVALSSNSSGIMGQSTSGCGGSSCHGGSASSATLLTITTNIPAAGYTAGTAYTVTATVTNSTKTAAGFDLSVSAGTLSSAPTGASIMGSEIHHTSPKTMSAGVASWTFTWTAPSAGSSVTFSFAGNAVNGNGTQSGDVWNTTSQTFTLASPTVTAPTATTGTSSGVTTNGAVVNGTVNANNGSTTATFIYGTTTATTLSTAATPATVAGNANTAVTATLSSLSPGTKYYYRVRAVNSAGTTNGNLDSFTTAAATSQPVMSVVAPTVGGNTTTVRASVSANSGATTVTLAYGTTKSYGQTGTVSNSPVAANTTATVSSLLTGLQLNTRYYYKFTATSSAGTVTKEDSFKTSTTAVANVAAGLAKLYPNPATNKLNIEFATASVEVEPFVISISGQRFAVTTEATGSAAFAVSTEHLAPGIYLLVFRDGAGLHTAPFQKQ